MGSDERFGRVEWELCDLCGALVEEDVALMVLVPDSSAVAGDPSLDGERLLTACCLAHMAELVVVYQCRPFVEEELWEGRVFRVLCEHRGGPVTVRELAEETGLSPEQVDLAVEWHNERVFRRQEERGGGSR